MARDDRTSTRERTETRAVLREATPAILALLATEAIVMSVHLDGAANRWDVALALLPVLPAVWLGWTQLRSLQRADEYQRLVQLEAMAVGFGTALLVALVGGLVDSAGVGSAAQSLQLTFILGVLAWAGTFGYRSR